MKTIIVTAAIIVKGNQILIAKRLPSGEQGSKWEFPGGKLRPGEEPAQGLRREIKEELNLDIEVVDIYEVVSHQYKEDEQILLLVYLCRPLSDEIIPLECADFKWVVQNELKDYDFSQADVPVAEKLAELFPQMIE